MKIILLINLLFAAYFVNAQTKIIAIQIPGLHEKAGSGDYDKIVKEALIKVGKATIEVMPPARAEKVFENCTNCCFSPANLNKEFYNFGSKVIETKPMGVAKIFIFSPDGGKKYSNISELKGKKVGVRHGMPYGKTFEKSGLSVQKTSDIAKNIAKLDSGRIAAMVAYVPDAYDAFKAIGKKPYPHDESSPVAVHPDALVCRSVPTDVIDMFNAYIEKI